MAVGFVLITTEPGKEIEVREAVSKFETVVGQWIVFGMHDLFVKIEADDESELTRCIIQDIRNLPGIFETRTLIGTEI
ncbi:Lrp/AsnC ligand binding domain-containing protein [Euryarchaeota archaeon]|jgi:DNA-binding Lrp family transcriptional regulator|nr:Lrp/AsnC ligand binding domain-containing protein [Euryarchaeota archaeon]MBT4391907.1 Lrp/AsnC ligand binding domain-containing protein [Euryarchaeota archaeon]MBT4803103.1 Lrp/AsnC ligand binding domain-containing protein [Euryarchaeota archaeon]MBT5613721.1 Lrp/AsnC ligand binding domain-containing protein [Euryarchaeota archaeon]MBT6684208.1 Lrp/AsnC ligand binding domain-containing protein [Euryarchaeota archaeon]|tara:strand:- start:2011 stop:2244 length:234 start_codon:yes stop_codon:yes gene_type:complete